MATCCGSGTTGWRCGFQRGPSSISRRPAQQGLLPIASTCINVIERLHSAFTIKPLPQFTAWLDELADASVRGIVVARIKRLERGLMGDVEPVGDGVSELRIHVVRAGGCASRSAARN